MRVSFVLLPAAVPLDGEAIARSHLRRFPQATRLVPEPPGAHAGPLVLRLQDDSGDVMLMPAPIAIATGEVEAAAQLSLTALSESAGLAPHTAHVIVTFRGERERAPADEAFLLAQVTAAVAEATGAVGVYWGMGHVAHPAGFFIETVSELEQPLPALIGLSVASDAAGPSLLSVGMEQFGLPDMLVLADPRGASDAMGFLMDIQSYVLERGEALPDGDTVGRSAQERIQVRYVPSPADGSVQVVQLDLRRPGLWQRARRYFRS